MFVLRYAVAAILGLFVASDSLAEGFWSYKDWIATAGPGGNGPSITCMARGGQEGWPYIQVDTSNADSRPPDVYPRVFYSEIGMRGIAPEMTNGAPIRFVLDTGQSFTAYASIGVDAYAIPSAVAVLDHADRQPMLKAMRQGSHVDVMEDGKRLMRISLSGFTAAYGKIAEQCGFPTVGVID